MDYVEHSQEYQQLVEQGPNELCLGEDEDGQGMQYQACKAEDGLENKGNIQSRWIFPPSYIKTDNANAFLSIKPMGVLTPHVYTRHP